jgi:S1-C subfamily serine protease
MCKKTNSLLYLLERIQKSFEGKLVGADRAKDIAVLKVCIRLHVISP